ncbi:hypothetical protein [Nocardioides jiangxiensis]|uniref:Uncharacterized protein n=1 Tax=Nocardioides jiangxiensis TaxID=3064524 RepID=A0ABT9B267_9ACTN|nr:hypothetical protein [Nocardioides sp. WY-20]MDO7868946.1 hypothetical protein [Nocardioides sp. WY-20]
MFISMHGVGGAKDLPIPAEYAIAGACAALTVSFVVLAVAWRKPHFAETTTGAVDEAGAPGGPVIGPVLRVLGFAFFLYVAVAALFGQDTLINPVFGVFYVLLWTGMVPLSLAFGPVYRALSPVRTVNALLARVSGADPATGLRDYPERLGYWPAAFGLLAFVWMELVFAGNAELGNVRLWLAVYIGAMVIGGAVYGNTFFARADPFEVYSTFVGHLSPLRRVDGRVVLVNPFRHLASLEIRPGVLAVCAVLLGSTAFDSLGGSSWWLVHTESLGPREVVGTLGLIGLIGVVGLLFSGATMLTGIHQGHDRRQLPAAYAHTLVPIIIGYVFAHYLSMLVESGQQTLIQLSDPLSNGSNVLGLSDRGVNYWLSEHPTFLAVAKVSGVLTGHVVAVIAAHDAAMRLLPKRDQLSGQLALLFLMVGFTAGGLLLLFGA